MRIMCLSGGTCLPLSSFHLFAPFGQVDMSLHSDTLSSFHVFAPFAPVDMSLHSDTLSWNEDNVSEWRDIST
jgi:hypothetical protein